MGAVSDEEPGGAKKKKRPKGVDEPALGFGRDISLDVRSALTRWLRGTLLVASIGFVFVLFGRHMADRDPRGVLVGICGGLLLAIGAWMGAVLLRNGGRSDLVLTLDHREIDVPRIALFGPRWLTCGLHEIERAAMMQTRNALWIELLPQRGPKTIIPTEWVEPVAPLAELFWRIELRVTLARRHGGKTPRAALVGTEALVGLGSAAHPIAGVVLSRLETKRPIVVASVASVPEFFARLSEWPEDAKLMVPSDVHAELVATLEDPSRLL